MEAPETRYVAVGDADVAYQLIGSGPVDLVYFYGLGSHVELNWDSPAEAEFLQRLGSIANVVEFDRRGTGASDGVVRSGIPTWEDWAEDLRAVLDAVGWDRAAIFAEADSGPIAILFAATHPERVSALVLSNTSARWLAAPDYPVGVSPEIAEAGLKLLGKLWGTTELLRLTAPSLLRDESSLQSFARCQRASATPRTAEAQYRYIIGCDVRDALPLVQAPTLVVHSEDNQFCPIGQGRYLAQSIPGAKIVTFAGADAGGSTMPDQFMDTVGQFLTGQPPTPEPDRILATVLFTDIVESTKTASSLGDSRWRRLLDIHDRLVRQELARFGGREVNTTGDGFVAAFDGPARAIRCAQSTIDSLSQRGIRIRVGVHTGECERRGENLAGLAVHIAARVSDAAAPSELLVTSTVRDLVLGSGIDFSDAGRHQLKGVPGSWQLLAAQR
jgi:class 3 adenylate cyclase/pimeloyl-ACP methyl ester carboxylesterase